MTSVMFRSLLCLFDGRSFHYQIVLPTVCIDINNSRNIFQRDIADYFNTKDDGTHACATCNAIASNFVVRNGYKVETPLSENTK